MKCPNCGYAPTINEFDYAEAPGRFYKLPVEAKRERGEEWYESYGQEPRREQVYGCPNCGVMFMNMCY